MFENGEKKSPAAFKNMDQCTTLTLTSHLRQNIGLGEG